MRIETASLSRIRCPYVVVVGLLLLLSPGRAAQELTVDIQNGPGTDFTQIQDAIDAAVPGTVIRIRPGLYQPTRTDKGLHLIGEQGVTVRNLGGQGPTITVVETLALELDVFSLGVPIDVSVRGLPGTPQLLLLGMPRAPLSVPGVSGFLHLDALDVIASGPLPPTGSLFVTFNTPPNQAVLIGVDFGFQALSLDSVGALHWSNAELSVLR